MTPDETPPPSVSSEPPEAPAPPPSDAPAPPPIWLAPPVSVPAPRRRRGILIAAAVAVALVVLVGIPVLLLAVLAKPSTHRPGAGSAAQAASPSATPLSPEAYQQTLTTVFTSLASSFSNPGTAHTGKAVRFWASNLEAGLAAAVNALKAVTPPAAVASAHTDLVSALAGMDATAGNTAQDGEDQKICGGSSALAQITGSGTVLDIQAAVKELTTADPAHPYTVPAFLPATTPEQSRRLANGTVIKKNTKGANVIKVENKTQRDAVMSYAPANAGAAAVMVYVQAGGNATVSGVHDGSYDLYETSGDDWDGDAKQFTRNCTYQRLNTPAQLKSNARQYTIDTVTLGGQADGSAPVTEADPGDFPT